MYYEFEQQGDFVDFVDDSIFTYRYLSEGGAWTGHVMAGAQYSLSSNLVLTTEGKYSWADAEMDRESYSGYDPIDLSGFRGTVGIGVRF